MQVNRQESEEEVKTLIWFLRQTVMEDFDINRRRLRRRKISFKPRLPFKGAMACCGATWGITTTRSSTISVLDDHDDHHFIDDHDQEHHAQNLHHLIPPIEIETETTHHVDAAPILPGSGTTVDPHLNMICVTGELRQSPTSSGMNLATALAVERLYRSTTQQQADQPATTTTPMRRSDEIIGDTGTPSRVSLMKLLEDSDGFETAEKPNNDNNVCCVCMYRNKGSAFIPCGHTFCRVCSREIWLNRGSCPLCNRSILEILDIF